MARAKVVQQVFSDDLDGTEVPDPDELSRVVIGVDGVFYQLDMVRKNVTGFKTAVKKYITAAEKAQQDFDAPGNDSIAHANVIGTPDEPAYDVVKGAYKLGLRGGGATSSVAAPRTSERAQWLTRVREWAKSNGHTVGDKGRLPANITDAYLKNNPEDPEPTA